VVEKCVHINANAGVCADCIAAHTRAVVEEREAEAECWEIGHTQDILMADGSVETRRLTKTYCPSCVDKAIDALRAERERLVIAAKEQISMFADPASLPILRAALAPEAERGRGEGA
jgi:Zn finger protein HypA/HybF involved in hydrogenase expression